MRIGFDAKRYFLNTTGLGNYSRNLVRLLHTWFPDNEYFLYTPKESGSPKKIAASTLPDCVHIKLPQTAPGRLFHPLWRSFLLGRETISDKLDIFHGLSHEIPFGLPAATRTAVTMHDLIFLRHPDLYNRIDVALYTAKYRSSCRRAHRIIAISEQTRQDIIHFFNIDENKISVVYQSCHKRFYEKVPDETKTSIRQRYNLPDNYILYVGSLAPRKNTITLIQALGHLPRDMRIPLVLVGQGSKNYLTCIHAAIEKAGVKGHVFFAGAVPDADLPGIYQMANLFVYPSLYEGFGIPILEALFSRTPVITSTGSCFQEAGGPCSLYTTPGDAKELSHAIQNVLNNPSLAQRMRDNGYEHALGFHERKVATRMMNLYTSLLT